MAEAIKLIKFVILGKPLQPGMVFHIIRDTGEQNVRRLNIMRGEMMKDDLLRPILSKLYPKFICCPLRRHLKLGRYCWIGFNNDTPGFCSLSKEETENGFSSGGANRHIIPAELFYVNHPEGIYGWKW